MKKLITFLIVFLLTPNFVFGNDVQGKAIFCIPLNEPNFEKRLCGMVGYYFKTDTEVQK